MRARPRLFSLTATLLLAALAALGAGPAVGAHPQDGPHADVRIRIGDDAVLFTVTMNLVWVDEIVEAPREDPERLDPVEGAPVRAGLREHFRASNHVTIDGVTVDPVVTGFEVSEPDRALLPLFPVSGARGLQKIRIVLSYPTKTRPEQVAMVWGTYPEDVLLSTPGNPRSLDVIAELDAFGIDSIVAFTAAEPEFIWHDTGTTPDERFMPVPASVAPRLWRVPVITVILAAVPLVLVARAAVRGQARVQAGALIAVTAACATGAILLRDGAVVRIASPLAAGPALPSHAEALDVFRPLHTNIYRAFDYTDESQVYDALARSVDGKLLDELYDEIYRSLIMEEEGGAVSRIRRVEPITYRVTSIGLVGDVIAFSVEARWQVEGAVSHWGHSHARTNEYLAEYTVMSGRDGWRIASSRVLEQMRVDGASIPPADRGV